MNPARAQKTYENIQWVSIGLASYFTVSFLLVACVCMKYPFALEWMEGQMIDVIGRVLEGKPVYTEPTLRYVPFAYTPYYYYVSAFVAYFTGLDFLAARLVSTLSALGCGIILFAWIRKEGGTLMTAVITAGMFFATYRISGRWFDNSRVDSLFLLLTLSGLYLFYFYRGWQNAITAACLLTAAFFTKQTALAAALPPLVAALWIDRKHAMLTLCVWLYLVASISIVGDLITNGWFSFYVFDLESHHSVQPKYVVGFWTGDMLRNVGILFAVAAYLMIEWFGTERKKLAWYAALAASMILCSYVGRLNWGGYANVLMPAHTVLVLLSGLAITYAERERQAQGMMFIAVLVAAQMALLLYNPTRMIPTGVDERRAWAFVADLAKFNGDVFIPEIQFIQSRAGKESFDLGMAAYDILSTDLKDEGKKRKQLRNEIARAIREQRFDAIVPGRLVPLPELQKYYTFQKHMIFPKEFVTGHMNFVLTDIYVPIKELPEDEDAPAKKEKDPLKDTILRDIIP